jgi:uncharacterized membrane protein YeaQ/YmgE (transglycosylase-associated protein family)
MREQSVARRGAKRVTMGFHGCHGRGVNIESILWCVVGAIVGALAGMMMGSAGKVVLVENVLVGVFGAFIGGEFIADMMKVKTPGSFSMAALGISITAAIVLLVLLKLMRRSVGPMRNSKSRQRH